jgi:hypothetical protein
MNVVGSAEEGMRPMTEPLRDLPATGRIGRRRLAERRGTSAEVEVWDDGQVRMSSGNSAVTMKFGTSTSWLMRRSTAQLESA